MLTSCYLLAVLFFVFCFVSSDLFIERTDGQTSEPSGKIFSLRGNEAFVSSAAGAPVLVPTLRPEDYGIGDFEDAVEEIDDEIRRVQAKKGDAEKAELMSRIKTAENVQSALRRISNVSAAPPAARATDDNIQSVLKSVFVKRVENYKHRIWSGETMEAFALHYYWTHAYHMLQMLYFPDEARVEWSRLFDKVQPNILGDDAHQSQAAVMREMLQGFWKSVQKEPAGVPLCRRGSYQGQAPKQRRLSLTEHTTHKGGDWQRAYAHARALARPPLEDCEQKETSQEAAVSKDLRANAMFVCGVYKLHAPTDESRVADNHGAVGDAAYWFRLAAGLDHRSANYALGFLFTQGKGFHFQGEDRLKEAETCFKKGSHPCSQYILGCFVELGLGSHYIGDLEAMQKDLKDEGGGVTFHSRGHEHYHVRVLFDFDEALSHFRNGATGKHAESQFMVGVLCSKQAKSIHTATKERESLIDEAMKNFQLAADQGHAEAAYALAAVYAEFKRDGLTGDKDRKDFEVEDLQKQVDGLFVAAKRMPLAKFHLARCSYEQGIDPTLITGTIPGCLVLLEGAAVGFPAAAYFLTHLFSGREGGSSSNDNEQRSSSRRSSASEEKRSSSRRSSASEQRSSSRRSSASGQRSSSRKASDSDATIARAEGDHQWLFVPNRDAQPRRPSGNSLRAPPSLGQIKETSPSLPQDSGSLHMPETFEERQLNWKRVREAYLRQKYGNPPWRD